MDINYVKPTTKFKNILVGELFVGYNTLEERDGLFCRTPIHNNTNTILICSNTDILALNKAVWFDDDDEVTRVKSVDVHY